MKTKSFCFSCFIFGALVSQGPAYSQAPDSPNIQNRVSAVDAKDTDQGTTIAADAQIQSSQGHFAEAEEGFKKALAIWSKKPPRKMLQKANCLNNLALLYFSTGRTPQSIPLYKEAMELEDSLVSEHASDKELPALRAITLDNLGQSYRISGDLKAAEPMYKRALKIEEDTLRPDDPDMAITRINLSILYLAQKNYKPAEELLLKSLPVLKKSLGATNPDYQQCVGYYVKLLRDTNRADEADAILKSKH